MANLNTLKNLFSKLKPAAKTVANYGDDVANAVVNYGDDAARMAFANADDLAAATAQSDDIARLIRDADAPVVWDSNNVPDGLDWDLIERSNEYGLSEFDFPVHGARNPAAGNTDDLILALSEPKMNLTQISRMADSRVPDFKTASTWDAIHRKLSRTPSNSPAQQVAKQVYPYTSSGLGEAADRAYDTFWLREYEGHGDPEAWATDYLGKIVAEIDPIEGHVSKIGPTTGSVPLAQWLPIDSLVGDVSIPPNFESVYPNGTFETVLRPHKNTALGRWYASKLK